jgi:putative peptidoglycan lipid II flippase
VRRVQHYSLAMVGPVGSAGAQFALSLVLLRRLDPEVFGGFSFLLVTCQLSWGVWGALFCAPLPAILAAGEPAARGSCAPSSPPTCWPRRSRSSSSSPSR